MIFVDAGVFYARFAERDRHHEAADRFFAGLLASPVPLVTTTAVLYETHALMLRISRVEPREDLRPAAKRFLEELRAGLARVVHVTPDDHRRGLDLVDRHADKSYSVCDAISFVVMERLRIKRAASFDRHFRQYGTFTVVL